MLTEGENKGYYGLDIDTDIGMFFISPTSQEVGRFEEPHFKREGMYETQFSEYPSTC